MADSSPETEGEIMECETSSPEEQTTQIEHQKIMEQVHQLLELNKYALLHQVIDLSIQHVNQRKEIHSLQQQMKKVLEERVQIKMDLIVQHNFKTNVQSVEDVKHAASIRLREKLEAINAQLKSNDAMRSHLKEDHVGARSEMEEITKLLDEITKIGKVLQRELKKGEGHLETLNQQLESAAAEKEQLQHDCLAKERELHNVSSHNAEIMQQIKNELMDKECAINQNNEELKREKQNLAKQANVLEQLQSDINEMRNNVEQLKQTVESELSKDAQHFRKEIAFSQKSFEEMIMKNEKLLEYTANTITDLNKQREATDARIVELRNKQCELSSNLQNVNDRNSKLQQELKNYDRNKHQEMELAKLKESIKASKAKEAADNRLNMQLTMRPRRQVFTKASKNNEAATNIINITIDSEQSNAFDGSVFFEGKL